MLGVRAFACRGCGTVHAGPEEPPFCDACDAAAFRELSPESRTGSYFWSREVAESRGDP